MVGEIRDRDTAGVAIEAALTGHLVFSTLHAGSACGVVGRLLDMGVEPYLLTSGIEDPEPAAAPPSCEAVGGVAVSWEPRLRAVGARAYRGRFLIAELSDAGRRFRRAILAKADTDDAGSRWPANPEWQSIRAAADAAVAAGRTTADEVARVLGPQRFARNPAAVV